MTNSPFGDSSNGGDAPFGKRSSASPVKPSELASAESGHSKAPAATTAGDLDGAKARRYEETFLQSYQHNLSRIQRVQCPLDGVEYDRHPDRESVREWDDAEEVRRIAVRVKGGAGPDKLPRLAGHQLTIYRKPLFGQRQPKVCLIGAVWSPVEQLAAGSVRSGASPGGVQAIEWLLERCMVDQRHDVFHYIGFCSTSGWEDFLLDPLPSGPNWVMGLVWPRPPGWLLAMPAIVPAHVAVAFDPEGLGEKRARVMALLRNSPELSAPGGLLLLQDVSDGAVVPPGLALDVMHEFCATTGEHEVRKVSGSTIIQRLNRGAGLSRGGW